MLARPTGRTTTDMLFPKRRHDVVDVDSLEDLAENLTEHTWTLCTGFRARHAKRTLLFLNDSTSADGAQEYTVLNEDGRQVESITLGWCTREEALKHLQDLVAGGGLRLSTIDLRLDPPDDHSCGHCQ